MAGRPPRLLGGAAEGHPDPPDRLAAQAQALHLLELLGQAAIVEAHMARLQQRRDALPHRRGQAAPRGLPSGAVDQVRCPTRLEAALEALHLPDTEPERGGHLPIR